MPGKPHASLRIRPAKLSPQLDIRWAGENLNS